MKRLACLIVVLIQGVCLVGSVLSAQTGKNPPAASPSYNPSQSIIVLGTPLVLKEAKKTAIEYLAEYIPESESFQNFTKMFAVWGRLDGSDAQSQVNAKIQFVKSRKGTDPLANYNLFQSDDKKMYGLDFLISQGDLMEQNIWTFQNVKGGVLAYQYARRHYEGKSPQSAEDFIKEVPAIRNQVLTFFKTAPLPRPAGYQGP